jgi:3,4-dihydroxy 2-butanone 4-phosphate synthase/GTP cyclohydrolase II
MKLIDYITGEGITRAEFARRAEISEATISLLCRNETWLSKEMAQKILKATDGKVTPTDFLEAAE